MKNEWERADQDNSLNHENMPPQAFFSTISKPHLEFIKALRELITSLMPEGLISYFVFKDGVFESQLKSPKRARERSRLNYSPIFLDLSRKKFKPKPLTLLFFFKLFEQTNLKTFLHVMHRVLHLV